MKGRVLVLPLRHTRAFISSVTHVADCMTMTYQTQTS